MKTTFVRLADQEVLHRKSHKDRYSGKWIVSSSLKKGRSGRGVMFEDLKYTSDPYLDPYKIDRKYEKKRTKFYRGIHNMPFRCPSPHVGSTEKKFKYFTFSDDFTKRRKKMKKKKKFDPKNFVTNPGKKGTYGCIGTTIGKFDVWDKPDPWITPEEVTRIAQIRANLGMKTKKSPFLPTGKSKMLFDERVYEDKCDKPLYDCEKMRNDFEPFLAAGPTRSTFEEFPEYSSDNILPEIKKRSNYLVKRSPKRKFAVKEKCLKESGTRKVVFPKLTEISHCRFWKGKIVKRPDENQYRGKNSYNSNSHSLVTDHTNRKILNFLEN